MDTTGLHTKEGRLEEGLRAPKPLITDGDDLTVGKLIGLLQGGGGSSGGHLLLKVQGNIAQLLLPQTSLWSTQKSSSLNIYVYIIMLSAQSIVKVFFLLGGEDFFVLRGWLLLRTTKKISE